MCVFNTILPIHNKIIQSVEQHNSKIRFNIDVIFYDLMLEGLCTLHEHVLSYSLTNDCSRLECGRSGLMKRTSVLASSAVGLV
jgi:hypothetical protein